jgi:hypothetical protein
MASGLLDLMSYKYGGLQVYSVLFIPSESPLVHAYPILKHRPPPLSILSILLSLHPKAKNPCIYLLVRSRFALCCSDGLTKPNNPTPASLYAIDSANGPAAAHVPLIG